MTTTQTAAQVGTKWHLKGVGYEFCNCAPGCACNFSGFPSSTDGSCRAVVGSVIEAGRCGEVDLSGITCAGVFDWPKAIHDGRGRAVFVVPESVRDDQLQALSKIFTGELKGMPWEILGSTYTVVGLVRSEVEISGHGIDSRLRVPGLLDATGQSFKNPVTGEPHQAAIALDDGFIWTHGECGVGSFKADTNDIHLDFQGTNWIHYEFDWAN